MSAKCPKCNGKLKLYQSICTDPECCGLDHDISCQNCSFMYESSNEDYIEEKWLELGGTKEEFDDVFSK